MHGVHVATILSPYLFVDTYDWVRAEKVLERGERLDELTDKSESV